MSGRECKPGDVAVVGGRDGKGVRAIWQGNQWATENARYLHDFQVEARPLVVIDPEDREQVVALETAWHEARESGPLPEVPMTMSQLRLRAALRSLVTPPKPDEPQGLGAVVEDAEDVYVHFGNGCWIKAVPNAQMYQRAWSDMTPAVKVLSEGVVVA